LREHGIQVDCGLLEAEARWLNAPYLKLLATARPWIIAKWAMTLDGKLASQDGHSQWISNKQSRAVAHQLRGRVDAIIVGRRTAEIDDPLLTARPAGPRIATRIVLDSRASLATTSQLVRTVAQAPVLVAASRALADKENCQRLQAAGCEVLLVDTPLDSHEVPERGTSMHYFILTELLDTLGSRKMTNVLVEGGSAILGSLRDRDLIDEVHVFIAPWVMGGERATSPIGGLGASEPATSLPLVDPKIEVLDGDVYVHGRVERP
jgi:diaminohydroxyphosphoribosylaminopyrimidine deaminase/5-amino-6-(5-phosphoribosylamino)uracil reductase